MIIKKKNILIISCIFGNKFVKVYEAPLNYNCYFFSNNIEIKQEVENKKWIFVYVNIKLSTDNVISSCNSKYIKFLAFLDEFSEFKKYKSILYFDHKLFVKEEDIDKLIKNSIKDNHKYNIIIRKHEKSHKRISSEIKVALGQERYLRNMDKTKELIYNKINNNEIKDEIEICNTGLIFYVNYKDSDIINMLNNIYNTCINLQQPECQIIWAIYSQKYLHKIKTINFYDIIEPLWKEPFTVFVEENNKYDSNKFWLLFFIIIIIIILFFIIFYKKNFRNKIKIRKIFNKM